VCGFRDEKGGWCVSRMRLQRVSSAEGYWHKEVDGVLVWEWSAVLEGVGVESGLGRGLECRCVGGRRAERVVKATLEPRVCYGSVRRSADAEGRDLVVVEWRLVMGCEGWCLLE
jgi:hypothetical protein